MSTIKHNISQVPIFCTNDYEIFTMIEGNRDINLKKINKTIKEIESGNDILQYCPVLVRVIDDKLGIYDGQHRFMVAKKLGRPVHYCIIPHQKSMAEIARINSNVETWKSENFLRCYITQGLEDYSRVEEFKEMFGFPISLSLILLRFGVPNTQMSFGADDTKELFQNGQFKIKEWDKAVEIAKDCKLFEVFSQWKSQAFVRAIFCLKNADKVDLADLAAAVNKRPELLTPQKSYKQYLFKLEEIFNVGKHKRVIIS